MENNLEKNIDNKTSFAFGKIDFHSVDIPCVSLNRKKFLEYGKENKFLKDLLDLSEKSTTHSNALELFSRSVAGQGFTGSTEFMEFITEQDYFCSNASTLLDDLCSYLSIFNGFALQVVWNRAGDKVARIYLLPFEKVFPGLPDERGIVTEYYLGHSTNEYFNKNSYTKYQAFDPLKAKDYPCQIYYFAKQTPSKSIFPLPRYSGALNYIESDHKLGILHLSNLNNGCVPSVLINNPNAGSMSPEERDSFAYDFKKSFQGVEKNGSYVITYSNGSENRVTIDPIAASSNNDYYLLLAEQIRKEIICAHGLTSPTLAGLDGGGTLGGNANEILTAFSLYQNSIIDSYQNYVEKVFKTILKYNNIDMTGMQIMKYELNITDPEAEKTFTEENTNLT